MVITVDQAHLDVHQFITCQETSLHCVLNSLLDRLDEFLRNRTTGNLVLEYKAFAGSRFDLNLDVSKLATTTGLFLIDLFAGRGITTAVHTKSDDEGVDEIEKALATAGRGLVFTNLVDSDTQYGHRNDPAGYAANLERFDARLAELLPRFHDRDLLVITADHGNDPTTASTDHAREYVPVFLTGASVRAGVDIGTRSTFADLGQTIAEIFRVGPLANGSSFLRDILQ